MANKRILKLKLLRKHNWDDLARRFPEAYEYLWLLAARNELEQIANDTDGDRRQELLWQLTDLSRSELRWDARFLC